jgi:hypothetical protein
VCTKNLQRCIAKEQLLELAAGLWAGILVSEDFAQLQLSPTGFVQDLILVVYQKAPNESAINRSYYHYVGNSGQSNNRHFVMGC